MEYTSDASTMVSFMDKTIQAEFDTRANVRMTIIKENGRPRRGKLPVQTACIIVYTNCTQQWGQPHKREMKRQRSMERDAITTQQPQSDLSVSTGELPRSARSNLHLE